MCDILYELSDLSEKLQNRSINIIQADRFMRHTIRSMESLKKGTGTHMIEVNSFVEIKSLKGIPIVSDPRRKSIDRTQLINRFTAAMNYR